MAKIIRNGIEYGIPSYSKKEIDKKLSLKVSKSEVESELNESTNPVSSKAVKKALEEQSSGIFEGTLDEWDALSPAEQAQYDFIATPESGEDAVDAMKQYISDQNELSDFDPLDGTGISGLNLNNTNVTCPYDGFINVGQKDAPFARQLFVNNVSRTISNDALVVGSEYYGQTAICPVKKGDLIRLSEPRLNSTQMWAKWYNKRDYSFRT
ncbi:hypothetical protein [Pseudobutyrivibrio sp.]|uniref:hypothetical protein n=1 Tax=Pseudobutyrivibrio sp. TaxID=2014367 RepID=UPI00386E3E72